MSANKRLLRDDQWARLAGYNRIAKNNAHWNALRVVQMILLGLALAVATIVDYILLLEAFSWILEDPLAAEHWNAEVLAAIGLVSVLAFHALCQRHRSARFERGLASAARTALAVFMLGVGLLLAGVVYSNGIGSLTTISSSSLVDFINDGVDEIDVASLSSMFEIYVLPVFPVIFAIGLGGTFIVSIYTAHVLLGSLDVLSRSYVEAAFTAKQSALLLNKLSDLEGIHGRLMRARNARLKANGGARKRHAEAVVTAGVVALRPAKKLIIARQLQAEDSPTLIFDGIDGMSAVLQKMPLGELQAKVEAASQSIRYEQVLGI